MTCTSCAPGRDCDDCVAWDVATLVGAAACRGHVWAERAFGQLRGRAPQPWPAYEFERPRAIALRVVHDLARDERALEALARAAHAQAARRWAELLAEYQRVGRTPEDVRLRMRQERRQRAKAAAKGTSKEG